MQKVNEIYNAWFSHKHPNNPNFMQKVRYMHIQFSDGRNVLYWRLVNASFNDNHCIYGITLTEAKARFTDNENEKNIEQEFQNWLSKQI
jgi:hypothetical protein